MHAKTDIQFKPADSYVAKRAMSLGLHFFPDHHVELQFPSDASEPSKVPILEVARWLSTKHRELDSDYADEASQFRVIARLVAQAWSDYGVVDEGDMAQYTYRSMVLGKSFQEHPWTQAAMRNAKEHPGSFEAISLAMSAKDLEKFRTNDKVQTKDRR